MFTILGHGHASSGLCAGLAVGDSMQFPPALTLTLGAAGAGAALLCDIDCAGSTAASAFGPVSEIAHHLAIEAHYAAVALIDPEHTDGHGAHRGLTHWWPWWILMGGAVALGCELSRWTSIGALIVLFTLAVRGLTIPGQPSTPQGRFRNPHTHQVAMTGAYHLMRFTPLWFLHKARKHVNRTKRIGGKTLGFAFGVGKLTTFLTCAGLVLGANYYSVLPQLGPWLGLLVWGGHFLHWLGDCPTEMGVPGWHLTRFWRLPKWLAFKAGGPFEVVALWVPMGFLACFLLGGAFGFVAHALVVTVLWYIAAGFGVLAFAIAVATAVTRTIKRRSYA